MEQKRDVDIQQMAAYDRPFSYCAFDEFRLSVVRRRLERCGMRVHVTEKTLSLLVMLIEHADRTVTKRRLIDELWNEDVCADASLMQHVAMLRRILGERAGDRRYIVTVPRVGYRFIGRVTFGAEETHRHLISTELCHNAQDLRNLQTDVSLQSSVALYKRAIEINPGNGAAHAGLAEAYSRLADFMFVKPADFLPAARRAAAIALELDPSDSGAALTMAYTDHILLHNPEAAIRRSESLLAVNPDCMPARRSAFWSYCAIASFDDAKRHARYAFSTGAPCASFEMLAPIVAYFRGNYSEAIAGLDRWVNSEARDLVRYYLGTAHLFLGNYEHAERYLVEATLPVYDPKHPAPNLSLLSIAALGYLYAASGRQDRANAILDDLRSRRATTYVPYSALAIVALGLGWDEEGLGLMRRAYDECDTMCGFAAVEPFFERIRDRLPA